MLRPKIQLLAALFSLAALSAPAGAEWFYVANSVFQADGETENHPTALSQVILMPREAVRPLVCVSYANSIGTGREGKIVSSVTVTRPATTDIFGLPIDAIHHKLALTGGVNKHEFLNCKIGPDMKAGDIVTFEHDLKGMPKLKGGGGTVDFIEVNGVVSDAGEPTLWNAPMGFRLIEGNSPNGLLPGKTAGWHHSTNSVYQADFNLEKHPKKLTQTVVIPGAAPRPEICVAYSNMSGNASKGKVTATAVVTRLDNSTEIVKLSSGVKQNSAVDCKKVGDLEAGDLVEFSFQMKGMPKLNKGEVTVGFADVSGVVTTAGTPSFRETSPPPPAPLPKPTPPPANPPPTSSPSPIPGGTPAPSSPSPAPVGGGGPISTADEVAFSKLMLNSTKVQLQRPKSNNPSKWLVVGPGTRAIGNTNQLVLSTAGVGSTIASAVADYERKMGSLGSVGSTLSSGDRAAVQWYSDMGSGGPTALRRDSGGGFHGELFRSHLGARHLGPFGSAKAALDWLKSQGL